MNLRPVERDESNTVFFLVKQILKSHIASRHQPTSPRASATPKILATSQKPVILRGSDKDARRISTSKPPATYHFPRPPPITERANPPKISSLSASAGPSNRKIPAQ